jgi:MSHA biogenesis protein MshP
MRLNRQADFALRHCFRTGFALPSAIFLIVVLAILGGMVVTVSGLQHTSSARDVMGTKAFQAAHAGIEWGAYKVLQQAALPGAGVCPASPTSIPMPAGTDLTGLTVSVACAMTNPPPEEGSRTIAGGNPLEFYLITATACNQPACPNTTNPGAGYVERQLQATIAR